MDFERNPLYLIPTLLYYLIVYFIVLVCSNLFPSGPCAVGLDFVSIFLAFIFTIALIIKNLYLTLCVNAKNWSILAIHLGVLTLFLLKLLEVF